MAVHGFDISEMNGSMDISTLKNKADFLILRCGYGSDFLNQDDGEFLENVRKCRESGMPYGVYLYSYARNTDMAHSEAWHVLRLIKGTKPLYGVWYDMEDASIAGSDLVSIAETFCLDIEAAGYYCGIYSMLSWLDSILNSSRLDRFDRWVAQWNDTCDYQKPYGIWQYTSSYVMNGRRIDANWAYKDYPKFTGGEVENMTKDEVLALINETVPAMITEALRKNDPLYKSVSDVPDYWRAEVQTLVEAGSILGDGTNEVGKTYSELSAIIASKRYSDSLTEQACDNTE